jgi:hypothetical protein
MEDWKDGRLAMRDGLRWGRISEPAQTKLSSPNAALREPQPSKSKLNLDSEIGTTDSADFTDFEEVIGIIARILSYTKRPSPEVDKASSLCRLPKKQSGDASPT